MANWTDVLILFSSVENMKTHEKLNEQVKRIIPEHPGFQVVRSAQGSVAAMILSIHSEYKEQIYGIIKEFSWIVPEFVRVLESSDETHEDGWSELENLLEY